MNRHKVVTIILPNCFWIEDLIESRLLLEALRMKYHVFTNGENITKTTTGRDGECFIHLISSNHDELIIPNTTLIIDTCLETQNNSLQRIHFRQISGYESQRRLFMMTNVLEVIRPFPEEEFSYPT